MELVLSIIWLYAFQSIERTGICDEGLGTTENDSAREREEDWQRNTAVAGILLLLFFYLSP